MENVREVQRRWRGLESRTTHAWWESVQYTDRNVHTNITLLIESSISFEFHIRLSSKYYRARILTKWWKICKKKKKKEIYSKREEKKEKCTTILILRLSPSFSLTTLIRIKHRENTATIEKHIENAWRFTHSIWCSILSTTGTSSSSSFHPRSCPSPSSHYPPSSPFCIPITLDNNRLLRNLHTNNYLYKPSAHPFAFCFFIIIIFFPFFFFPLFFLNIPSRSRTGIKANR